ncbi:MAG: cobalamin-dependent protein [Deltaproteobacteria bacterium]|nr:cobalamin-dependent protein [Deltaproteobacteria bacterium]
MKLNIIFPKRENDWFNNAVGKLAMPVAPTYLAALTPRDVEIRITDMMAGDIVDYEEEVDLVAITVRTPVVVQAYRVADEFRSRDVSVILGGPHATVLPLEAKNHADAIVVGEAENIWNILLKDFQTNNLKDFYIGGPFSSESLPGEIYHIKERPDLHGIPRLRRDLLPRRRYLMDSIFTSRGCSYKCTFCGNPKLFGSTLRHRPIDEVVGEIETLPANYLNINDNIFGNLNDHQYYFDLYGELAKLTKKRFWFGEGALAVLGFDNGKALVKRAADSGLFRLVVGIESVHGQSITQAGAREKLGLNHGEHFNADKIQNSIKTIQDFGIEIFGFFMIGFDADSPDTLRKIIDFCHKTKIIPMITILSPTPDSPLYEKFKSEGRLLSDLSWNQYVSPELIFKHPSMTGKEMQRIRDEILNDLYRLIPIAKRVISTISKRPHPIVFFSSLFTQLGIRQGVKKEQTV